MLSIGYLREPAANADEALRLAAAGCQVIRAETPDGDAPQVLDAILGFIGPGDRLVVSRLDALGLSGRTLLEMVDRLERRGASLEVLEPALSSRGPQGSALRAALEAVAALEPAPRSRQNAADALASEVQALHRAGLGPVEIARRLGVSRMTVWRKLRGVAA